MPAAELCNIPSSIHVAPTTSICRCPDLKYGAEYNGPRWHGEDRAAYDAERIAWLVEHDGWIIDVFESAHVYGASRDPGVRLRQGIERARRRTALWRGRAGRGTGRWLG